MNNARMNNVGTISPPSLIGINIVVSRSGCFLFCGNIVSESITKVSGEVTTRKWV
jgi:hypothetical protein